MDLPRTALIFPGQGSQYPGMATDLIRDYSEARILFEQADEILRYPLSKIILDGDSLSRTIYTQPAVFTHSMALMKILESRIPLNPLAAAGHSLGEYTALCCAGVMIFDDALELIHIRAESMDSAGAQGSNGMLAVLGVSLEQLLTIVETCREDDVLEAANFNSPDQVVLSGTISALDRAAERIAKEKRAKTVKLQVSSAFHTKLMTPAAERIGDKLAGIALNSPKFPVVSNYTAEFYPADREGITNLLINQVTHPVRWESGVHKIRSVGADVFMEVGPGKVLTGLLKRIDRKIEALNISDSASLAKFVETF
jgi:[acyl-carrier-protein] S-malonyltransferase